MDTFEVESLYNRSVTDVVGIGEESASKLAELNISSISDLLETFPSRYEDQTLQPIEDLVHDEKATVEGEVVSLPLVSYFGKRKSRVTFKIRVDLFVIQVVLFNQTYVKNSISLNDLVMISGKWDQHRMTITGTFVKKSDNTKEDGQFKPVYSLRGVIPQYSMRKWIKSALHTYQDEIEEVLPNYFLVNYKIPSRKDAIQTLHNPITREELKHARRRIVYEELLFFQLKMQMLRKKVRESSEGVSITYNENELTTFIKEEIPFELTSAQKRVTNEILTDLKSPYVMNRLLQGDVGSGKTIIAAIAAYVVYLDGKQSAIMVPTEILAEQHFESFKERFENKNIRIELLTSSCKGKKREEVYSGLESGEIDIVIGTHALLQEKVQFHSLGLVVTDEQHRFGVEQRKVLREKGWMPNVLHMTATPIPRTLAITAFGEMDVSTIDELPKGRKAIETRWVKPGQYEEVWAFMETELNKGRQAYVICPLIEESEKLDLQNAVDLYGQLSERFMFKQAVGLLHGRMNAAEKDEIMSRFKSGELSVLVSTTVIEVGVNVPNASVMVIYDSERFGLAQLHQLRGRVGRGTEQSYCILLGDPKTDVGKERMLTMTQTNNGFEIAEKDLQLRGPGDFFGSKQSGMPEFKMADLLHDYRALEVARKDAVEIIGSENLIKNNEYIPLRNALTRHLQREQGMFD